MRSEEIMGHDFDNSSQFQTDVHAFNSRMERCIYLLSDISWANFLHLFNVINLLQRHGEGHSHLILSK